MFKGILGREIRGELLHVQKEFDYLKAAYEQEISERKNAELALIKQNNDLAKLNEFAIELSMLSSQESLEEVIIKHAKAITGAKFMMFSNYDPVARITTTDHIDMEPGLFASFVELVGKGKNLQFEVNDEMYAYLTTEVIGIGRTMHEMSFGTIPRTIGAAMKTMLRVDRFIGLSYLIKGEIYGTSLLGMDKNMPDPPKQMMESFSFLAAVSLRRKQAEVALQKSYDMLNKITGQVPGVVYEYRLYPDGRSAFPYSSPGMYDIYEVTPEEVHEDATPVFGRIHPDDYQMIVDTINQSARDQSIYHSEFRVILPSKGCRWRLCDAKPSRLDDGSTLWYGIISDITDRKMAEKELIQAKEKAEESDRLKSAFLANISHEIRTPMNGILGFAELLKEPDLTGEEQQEYVRIIEKSGQRMLNIINDIIDISKIESGQMEILISDTNVNDQLDFIYSFFKPEVEQKGMELLVSKSLPHESSVIRTDKEKVYAILTNFVKNAIKYTRKGSISFGYESVDHSLQFYVKDTGAGIPADRQAAIFERFVQADIADKQALQGAGLGLSISKAYVEMLGGKIWVESEPGIGSSFYFTVPVSDSRQ